MKILEVYKLKDAYSGVLWMTNSKTAVHGKVHLKDGKQRLVSCFFCLFYYYYCTKVHDSGGECGVITQK